VQCIKTGAGARTNFRSAADAVLVASMMRKDAHGQRTPIKNAAASGSTAAAVRDSSVSSLPGRARELVQVLLGRSRQG
jgi:hypothetical protein